MSELSDRVQDARLKTYFLSPIYRHEYNESNRRTGQRSIVRFEDWERRKHLARGGFGTVWLEECKEGKQRGELRAVKEIKRPDDQDDYHRELEALVKFSHEKYSSCFVNLLGWYEDTLNIYIAMDYFPLGDLESYLQRSSSPLPERDVQQITVQLLEGVAFMHKNSFAHRDLKPANILIDSQPPQDWWVKISDFGISKRVKDSQAHSSNRGGTRAYTAPERQDLFTPGGKMGRKYPNAADMWAVGEILHKLLTKNHVFDSFYALFQFTENGEEFPNVHLQRYDINDLACDFIRAAMAAAPAKRMTVEEAQHHRWMELSNMLHPPLGVIDATDVGDALSSSQVENVGQQTTTSLRLPSTSPAVQRKMILEDLSRPELVTEENAMTATASSNFQIVRPRSGNVGHVVGTPPPTTASASRVMTEPRASLHTQLSNRGLPVQTQIEPEKRTTKSRQKSTTTAAQTPAKDTTRDIDHDRIIKYVRRLLLRHKRDTPDAIPRVPIRGIPLLRHESDTPDAIPRVPIRGIPLIGRGPSQPANMTVYSNAHAARTSNVIPNISADHSSSQNENIKPYSRHLASQSQIVVESPDPNDFLQPYRLVEDSTPISHLLPHRLQAPELQAPNLDRKIAKKPINIDSISMTVKENNNNDKSPLIVRPKILSTWDRSYMKLTPHGIVRSTCHGLDLPVVLEIWNVRVGGVKAKFQCGYLKRDEDVLRFAFDPIGTILVTTIGEKTIAWDADGRICREFVESSDASIESIAISPGGLWIASGHERGIKIRMIRDDFLIEVKYPPVDLHSFYMRSPLFCFSSDGEVLALVVKTSLRSIYFKVMRLSSQGRHFVDYENDFELPSNAIQEMTGLNLAISSSGGLVAFAFGNTILLFEISSKKVIRRFSGEIYSLLFFGGYLIGEAGDGYSVKQSILVWDLQTGRSRILCADVDSLVREGDSLIGLSSDHSSRKLTVFELASATDLKALFDDGLTKPIIPESTLWAKERAY